MEYLDHRSGLKVRLDQSQKNNAIVLKAYVVDPETLEKLSSSPKTCTIHRIEDYESRKQGLVNKTCSDWLRKNRTRGSKPTESSKLQPSIVRDTFDKLDFDSNFFTTRWGAASTRKQAAVFFRRNTIPFIESHLDEPCTRADVEELYNAWAKRAHENGNSNNNQSQVRRTVNNHLSEAAFIYAAMCELEPSLPEIDFSGFMIGRNIHAEMAKSLPEPVRQRLTVYLEEHIPFEPAEVRGTVLMYDAALRTAEGAGQLKQDFGLPGMPGVVRVRAQEKDGERNPHLKTGSAYRNVTLTFWGLNIVNRCNALIDEGDETAPVITAKRLRTWIKKALLDCGLEDEFLQAARKLMDEEPDYLPDGTKDTDIIAYILRKDRATRWLNECGLNCVDVDYLLGHKIDLPRSQMPNFKTPAHHLEIAPYLENYVYDPKITAHPFFSPVILQSGEKRDLGPAVGYTFRCAGPGKGKMHLQFNTREVGAVIEVRVPKGIVPKANIHTLPRRDLRDQPIIGDQPIQFIDNN